MQPVYKMAPCIISMNLNGRFRSGNEANGVGQAVLQRILRGTDIFLGQQAQFSPCLPGNYRMIGTPSAFIVYNCQLYSATEVHRSPCPVHSTCNETSRPQWIASRIFFEQTCQEILAISWFAEDAVQSKKKHEVVARRLLAVARQLSSTFGLPLIIGGSFHLTAEDVVRLLQEPELQDFRCYGYWLDSMRRSVRASDLFVCSSPEIELNHVRPRSISGNICLGYKNDIWINPEDSFYWDPLSAKITVKLRESPQIFPCNGGQTIAAADSNKEIATTRGARKRPNFDVIRSVNNSDAGLNKTEKSKPSNFALISRLIREPSTEMEASDHSVLPLTSSSSPQVLTSKHNRWITRSNIPQHQQEDEMKELLNILTRLKVGSDVQIGELELQEATAFDNSLEPDKNVSHLKESGDCGLLLSHKIGLNQDDDGEILNGQFSRKLSTISESGESTCSSFAEDDFSTEQVRVDLEEADSGVPQSDGSDKKNFFENNSMMKRESVEGQTDESTEECETRTTTTRVLSKQSSQDERFVEGSSDIDLEEKALSHSAENANNSAVKRLPRFEEVGTEAESSSLAKDQQTPTETVLFNCRHHEVEPISPIYEHLEENRFESNFNCCLM